MSKGLKVIVAGSRTITDPAVVDAAIRASGFEVAELVSGGARGVDVLGECWAKSRSIPVRIFRPDWNLGKKAGPLRNAEMAEYADALVAIWDGQSRGTASMIGFANMRGLDVYIHHLPEKS